MESFASSRYDRIVILEAFRENYDWLKAEFEGRGGQYQVVHGRAQEVEDLGLGMFDVVFFWHGPEHLPEEEIAPTLQALERVARHVVVCGMPFGFYEQGSEYGNPFEVHRSHITPEFMNSLGYRTQTLGTADRAGSSLTAYKHLKAA